MARQGPFIPIMDDRGLRLPQCIPMRVNSHPLIPNRSDYSACLVHPSETTLHDFDKRQTGRPIAVSVPEFDIGRGGAGYTPSSSFSCLFNPLGPPINGATKGWLTVPEFTIASMRSYGVKAFETNASFPVTYISATRSVQPDFDEEERFGQAEVAPLLKERQKLVELLLGLRDWEMLRQRAAHDQPLMDRGCGCMSERRLGMRAYREMLGDALRHAKGRVSKSRSWDGCQEEMLMRPLQYQEKEKEEKHKVDCVEYTIEYMAYPSTAWNPMAWQSHVVWKRTVHETADC